MAYAKWIGASIGALSGGVLGMLAGYAIGSLIDNAISHKNDTERGYTYTGRNTNTDSTRSAFNDQRRNEEEARNGFLFSLMVLSAHIIKADGKVMHSEMETVRSFLRNNFGEVAVQQGNDILLRLFEYRKQTGDALWDSQLRKACYEMRSNMPEEHRLQLLAFLAEIAKADGHVDRSEYFALRDVTIFLGFYDDKIIDRLLSLGGNSLDDAYKVLGVAPDATDEEIKKAYRNLVRQNHPDRMATLGEDVKKAAEKKMQEINDAKERIFKARGM